MIFFSLALVAFPLHKYIFLYLPRPRPLELFYDLLLCQAQFLKDGLALIHE